MRKFVVLFFISLPIAAQCPSSPPAFSWPEPSVLNLVALKSASQQVLPPQYRLEFTWSSRGCPVPPPTAPEGDAVMQNFSSGMNIDAKGNTLVVFFQTFPNSSLWSGSTIYIYDPYGTKSVFGTTGGTCTQDGADVVYDYTIAGPVWYNPSAKAYYAETSHSITHVVASGAGYCSGAADALVAVQRYTFAVIRIDGMLNHN